GDRDGLLEELAGRGDGDIGGGGHGESQSGDHEDDGEHGDELEGAAEGWEDEAAAPAEAENLAASRIPAHVLRASGDRDAPRVGAGDERSRAGGERDGAAAVPGVALEAAHAELGAERAVAPGGVDDDGEGGCGIDAPADGGDVIAGLDEDDAREAV